MREAVVMLSKAGGQTAPRTPPHMVRPQAVAGVASPGGLSALRTTRGYFKTENGQGCVSC